MHNIRSESNIMYNQILTVDYQQLYVAWDLLSTTIQPNTGHFGILNSSFKIGFISFKLIVSALFTFLVMKYQERGTNICTCTRIQH